MPISQVGDKMPFPANDSSSSSEKKSRETRKISLGKSGQKKKSEVAHNRIAIQKNCIDAVRGGDGDGDGSGVPI